MSKKNSSVILKNQFKDYKDLSNIYSLFSSKIKNSKSDNFTQIDKKLAIEINKLFTLFQNLNKCHRCIVSSSVTCFYNPTITAISLLKSL